MYDASKVILGIVVFLALMTSPIWYGAIATDSGPLELAKPVKGDACVEGKEFMRHSHMDLLDTWRNAVVRDGNRMYTNTEGHEFTMSLQNTCLDCHQDKVKFCDECHNKMQVAPKCWDCHIAPNTEMGGSNE